MSLRTDERQWLIYGEEQQGAVMRGVEAWALLLSGARVRQSRSQAMRAIGTFMVRVGEQRLHEMDRRGGAQAEAARMIRGILLTLAGKRPWTPDVERDLDEIYSVVFRLDGRASRMGATGPGVERAAVRGD